MEIIWIIFGNVKMVRQGKKKNLDWNFRFEGFIRAHVQDARFKLSFTKSKH